MIDAPEIELDSRRGRTLLATVVLGSAVASLTATVVNVALPTLASGLDANSAEQKWIINGYTLTLAAFILAGGSLGDRFGRRRIYRIGVIWFALASLLCAVSWNSEALIGFRLLQGVGGALLTPGSLAIIESSLRREDRGRGVGAWSGMIGLAGALGPLLGGLLVEFSWRWVFVVNIPVAIAVVVLSPSIPETRDRAAEDAPVDVTGALLSALVLGAVSYVFIEGPERGFSPFELLVGVVGAAGALLFWRVERRTDHPMLPLDLFADRTFAVANSLTFVIYGGMGVLFFLLPIQLQVTAGWSPLESGTALLPVTVIMLLLSSKTGDLAHRIGPRWPLTVGSAVVAIGMVMVAGIGPGASFVSDVLPAVTVFGLGLAGIVAPVTTAALGSVPDDRAGAASGTNNAVARTGGLLAVAAIPGLVGLNGDALADPALLDPGFQKAMWTAAAIVACGAPLALILLRPEESRAVQEPAIAAGHRDERRVHRHGCPVDGQLTSIVEET